MCSVAPGAASSSTAQRLTLAGSVSTSHHAPASRSAPASVAKLCWTTACISPVGRSVSFTELRTIGRWKGLRASCGASCSYWARRPAPCCAETSVASSNSPSSSAAWDSQNITP